MPVASFLLAADAYPDNRDCGDGDTPLDAAAMGGHREVLRVLIERGADINTTDDEGKYTPLQGCFLRPGGCRRLIDRGRKRHRGNGQLWTHNSCVGSEDILEQSHSYLAAAPSEPRKKTLTLHLACRFRHRGLEVAVGLLLRWGADETAADNDGRTPAMLLDSQQPFSGLRVPRCPREGVDRARAMPARAPPDKAWRRRGWLVILRSYTAEARSASCESSETRNGCGVGSSAAGGHGQEELDRKRALRNDAGGVDLEVPRKAMNSNGVAGTDAEDEDWRGLVASLLEPELEGVFRTVVGLY